MTEKQIDRIVAATCTGFVSGAGLVILILNLTGAF